MFVSRIDNDGERKERASKLQAGHTKISMTRVTGKPVAQLLMQLYDVARSFIRIIHFLFPSKQGEISDDEVWGEKRRRKEKTSERKKELKYSQVKWSEV